MPRAKKRSRQKKNKSAKAMLHLPSSGPNSHFVVGDGNQAKVGLEGCCMVFSPQESPVYGGDELVVTVDNLNLPTEAEFFILYTGLNERRVTRAQRINNLTFQANIPDHNLEEVVDLDIFYRYEEEEVCYQRVAKGQFRYCYDSAHHLAQQLLESKADEESFKLAVEKEDLSTLDVRLRKALEYIASTEGWPSDHCKSEGKPAACDKLLDFAAYFGLPQVTSLVLTEVGTDAVHITNSKGQTPRDVALAQGHNHIADLLTSNTRTLMKSDSMKFERDGVVVHRNRNGAISIATTNVHEDTVRGDMELLKSIEIDIAKEQLDIECDQEDVIHLGKRDNESEDIQTSVDNECEDSFKNTPNSNENEEEKEKADSLKSTPEEEKTSANILSTEDDAVINANINDHSINTEATESVSALDVNTDSTAAAGNEVAEKESTLHIEEDQDALTKQLGSATEAITPVVTTTDKIQTNDEMSSPNSHSESINCADTENINTELSAVVANQAGAVDHFLEEDSSSEASDEIIDFSTQETPVADVTTTSTTDAAAISAETTTACNNSDGSISPTKSTADSKIFDTVDGGSECATSVAVNDTELIISTSDEPSLVHETSAISESTDAVGDPELNTLTALTEVSTSKTEPTEPILMPSSSVTGAEPSDVMPNSSINEIESSTVISGPLALESESNEIVSDSPDNDLVTSTTMPESSTSESVTPTTVPESSTSGPVSSTTDPDSFISEGVTSTTMPESSTSESVTSSTMPDSVTTGSMTSPVSDSAVIESVTSIPVSQVSSLETENIVLPESVPETDDVSNPPVPISDIAAKQFNTTSASDVSTTVPHMSMDSSEANTVSTSQIPVTNPQPSITTPENIDTFSEELSSVSISKTPLISEICSPPDSTTTDTANTESSLIITESTCSVCLSANCECDHPDTLQVSHQTPIESTVPEKHAAPNTESILESESNVVLTSVENSRENSEAAISSQPLSPLSKSQATPSPPLSSPSPPPFPSTASAALTPPTPPVSAPPPEAVFGDCGSTNNTFSKAQQEAVSSDSPFQEYGTHRILKGEPLSNGHTISSLLNNNCDLGSLGVLDTLLEERETSEEPVEKSPMVLTESIEAVRSISRHIQKLRNHGLGLGQNVKPDNLQRYRSCPILDVQDRCTSPSASEESVHHRSMLDLAPGVERQPVYSDTVFTQDLPANLLNSGLYQDYDPVSGVDGNDSGVRICINGVTVGNSSENLAVSTAPTTENNIISAVSELVKSTAECVHGTEGRFVSAAGRDKVDFDPGPVSAGYGEHVGSGAHKETRGHQRTHSEIPKSHRNLNYIRSTMASSLSGKSHSLNSLTGAEESDEDSFHDARENPTPSQSMMNLSTMPSDAIQGHQRSVSSGDAYSSYGKSTFTDSKRPPSWPSAAMFDYQKIMEDNSASMPSPDTIESPDSVFSSDYPYTAKPDYPYTAKSSSTSCLPAATDGSKGMISQMKRQNKQYYTQKLEDNEKFRRQQEFEEIDEVAEINKEAVEPRKIRDKKDFGKNFHDMLISSSNKDEKDKDKNEEKKKKSSNVLAKFGSTRKKFKKGKDGKEKENKHKNAHQFVSLSISNTSLCHVCNKSMANKAAVQCENCLINVHESSCKEQIPFCTKLSKSKSTLQEGSNHGLREKQYPSAPVQSTKCLDSSKRSSSAPAWPQEGNLSQTWPDQRISEEREEYGSNRPESMHSNIGETISESMESLDEHGMDQTVLESDPFLCMEENEPEAWSISVEKKVVKKLSSKEVKRQDHIYELVLTEKRYCRKLTIMQKIICNRLVTEAGLSPEGFNLMFPCLEELLAIHVSFFNNLQQLQSQNKDNIVDEIGKTLIEQFDGESSERIKSVYGYFCSHHKESASVYKELITDRKVLSLVKRWSSNSLFEKREIPDFLLIVTHRLTKYPTMIESILKNTKDKKERDNLLLALEHIKDILTNVNSRVEEYERAQHLEDIIQRIDPRSSASYRGRKFKKFDLNANSRRLIHEGEIGWKTSRGKVTDVTVLVLTDLIVLMQENNQKYTLTNQDNKSCVIPLYELLVREKGDTKDCKGIYLISKRQTAPEMYELVCKSTEDMKSWINHLSYAVSKCPRDVPVEATQSFKKLEEQKIMEIRRQRIRQLFEKMKSLDQEIIKCCDDKKCLLVQYAELLSHDDGAPTIVSSTPNTSTLSSASTSLVEAMEKHPLKEEGIENEYLQYALKEITKLTKVLQESSACLMSPVGGGTDHLGSSISTHAVPKRAETFAGFDSDLRKDPGQKRPHSYVNQEGRSASMFNLHESDSSGSKDSMKMNNRKSTGYIQSMVNKHHTLDSSDPHQMVNLPGMALASPIDLPPVPSNSDTSTILTPPTTALDQNTTHIYHFLHSFLQLSSQQNTTIEDLRTQLSESKETICKMNTEKLEINKHSQLEGLRNLKEELMREREEFELEKKRNRENQEKDTTQLQKEKDDLKSQQEELRRGQIALQKQIDLFMERRSDSEGRRQLDRAENPEQPGFDGDSHRSSIQHNRSSSAEFASQTSEDYKDTKDSSKPIPKSTVGNLVNSSGNKTCAPHLYSATNEQRSGEKLQQFLPLKLADNLSSSLPNSKGASQSQHRTGLGRSVSSSSFSGVKDNSSLSQIMKLAEPSRSAHKDRPPNHPPPKSEPTETDIIYF